MASTGMGSSEAMGDGTCAGMVQMHMEPLKGFIIIAPHDNELVTIIADKLEKQRAYTIQPEKEQGTAYCGTLNCPHC